MKYYKELIGLGCFSRKELASLCGSEAAANSLIFSYQKKGYIERVRRDLYTVISLETLQPAANRFEIASKISDDAVVSHHSAFEFYGYANQVFREVYVSSKNHFRDFTFDGFRYRRAASETVKDYATINRTRVTSIEKTVVDSISDFKKIGGLEETIRCIMMIPSLNEEKLLSELSARRNGFIFQKTGYILEQLNDRLHLSDSFFDSCRSGISRAPKYLLPEKSGMTFHKKWLLYVPPDITVYVDKGVGSYVGA